MGVTDSEMSIWYSGTTQNTRAVSARHIKRKDFPPVPCLVQLHNSFPLCAFHSQPSYFVLCMGAKRLPHYLYIPVTAGFAFEQPRVQIISGISCSCATFESSLWNQMQVLLNRIPSFSPFLPLSVRNPPLSPSPSVSHTLAGLS